MKNGEIKSAEILKIGDRLRHYRESKDKTQAEIAEASGINVVQYRRYENNSSVPRPEQLDKIVEAFNEFDINGPFGKITKSNLTVLTDEEKEAWEAMKEYGIDDESILFVIEAVLGLDGLKSGDRIKKIRTKKELTPKELGDLCTPVISELIINGYESGEINPELKNMKKIANALEVPVEALYSDEEARAGLKNAYAKFEKNFKAEIKRQHQEIIGKYDSLNRNGQKEALKRLDELSRLEEYKGKEIKIELKYGDR